MKVRIGRVLIDFLNGSKDFDKYQVTTSASHMETTPHGKYASAKGGVKGNIAYFQRHFNNPIYQRNVLQYMFGGILRAMFGLLNFWNHKLDNDVTDQIREDYLKTKAKGTYGIYQFRVTNRGESLFFRAIPWPEGQPPVSYRQGYKTICLQDGDAVFIRVNLLDYPERADIEYLDGETVKIVTVKLGVFKKIKKSLTEIPDNKFPAVGNTFRGRWV